MMNGLTVIAFRKYEAACETLKNISGQLEAGPEARAETLDKIQIAHTREMLPGVGAVARAIGEMIKADLPRYCAEVIAKAQADVCMAAAELRGAIDADLESKFMRGKNGER
jgi:hypothetical protein